VRIHQPASLIEDALAVGAEPPKLAFLGADAMAVSSTRPPEFFSQRS
jgi:hypothetical protein